MLDYSKLNVIDNANNALIKDNKKFVSKLKPTNYVNNLAFIEQFFTNQNNFILKKTYDRFKNSLKLSFNKNEEYEPISYKISENISINTLGFLSNGYELSNYGYVFGLKYENKYISFRININSIITLIADSPVVTVELYGLGESLRDDMKSGHPEKNRIIFKEKSLIELFSDGYVFENESEREEIKNIILCNIPKMFFQNKSEDEQPIAYIIEINQNKMVKKLSLDYLYKITEQVIKIECFLAVDKQDYENYLYNNTLWIEWENKQDKKIKKSATKHFLFRYSPHIRKYALTLESEEKNKKEVEQFFLENKSVGESFQSFLEVYDHKNSKILIRYILENNLPLSNILRTLRNNVVSKAVITAAKIGNSSN